MIINFTCYGNYLWSGKLVYGRLGLCIFMLGLGLAFVYILSVNRTRLGYCRPVIDFKGFSFNFSASRFLKQIPLIDELFR